MARATTAYVLAAGLGTRLRPLTLQTPKPLLEVCGTALVVHALRLLERAGITRVALNSHWLHPSLPTALGPRVGALSLHYTHEPTVLGTGGGLCGLRAVCPPAAGERVLVMNADALIDLDVAALLRVAKDDALATLVLKDDPDKARYGVLGTDANDRITTFAGRVPAQGDVVRERMFCGVHVLDVRALDVLPPVTVKDGVASGSESGINDSAYPVWMTRGERLDAFNHDGTFCDVGTPERLLEANLKLLTGAWSSAHLRPFDGFVERSPGVWIHPGAQVAPQARLVGPVMIDDGAVVAAFADVGPLVVVGKRARIGKKARLAACVVQSDGVVEDAAVDCLVSAAHRVAVDANVGQAVRAARHL